MSADINHSILMDVDDDFIEAVVDVAQSLPDYWSPDGNGKCKNDPPEGPMIGSRIKEAFVSRLAAAWGDGRPEPIWVCVLWTVLTPLLRGH
jgi:hypothetical protein